MQCEERRVNHLSVACESSAGAAGRPIHEWLIGSRSEHHEQFDQQLPALLENLLVQPELEQPKSGRTAWHLHLLIVLIASVASIVCAKPGLCAAVRSGRCRTVSETVQITSFQ